MKNHNIKAALLAVIGFLFPVLSQAQDMAGEIHSLQSVLDQLYDEMIPLCSQLIGVGRGLAGFAAFGISPQGSGDTWPMRNPLIFIHC